MLFLSCAVSCGPELTMRGLIRLSFVFPAIVAGIGAGVLALWPIGEVEPASFPSGDAERGAYLARASGCVSCHTNSAAKGLALAGGAPLDTPFGTFVPPNITPHREAGIGRWTVQDFAKAVRQGVSPDGEPYYPVFTYSFYAGFTDQDIADLWEAFRTVPAVGDAAPPHDVGLPFNFRSGLKLWRAAYLDTPKTDALMGTSSPWNRGRQLVEGAAHCAACGGDPYYPVFTYSFYAGFTDQDIADLWEAFRTVPAVGDAAPPHDVGFPFSFRSGLKLWRAAYLETPKTDALMGTSSPWNRGRVLVEGAAHCAACHTGRTLAGGLDDGARFAGNDSLPGGSKAPPILSDVLLAKGWGVANLAYALQSGILPNGDAFGGSMAEVVAEGTSFLSAADREAIATYLLDPEGTGDIPAPAPTPVETPMAGMDHSQMDMGNGN